MSRRFRLKKDEHILTAYAQRAAGPGWSNSPVWVIVRGVDGVIRQECLQPDEMSEEMHHLYVVSAAVHGAMTEAVEAHCK